MVFEWVLGVSDLVPQLPIFIMEVVYCTVIPKRDVGQLLPQGIILGNRDDFVDSAFCFYVIPFEINSKTPIVKIL